MTVEVDADIQQIKDNINKLIEGHLGRGDISTSEKMANLLEALAGVTASTILAGSSNPNWHVKAIELFHHNLQQYVAKAAKGGGPNRVIN